MTEVVTVLVMSMTKEKQLAISTLLFTTCFWSMQMLLLNKKDIFILNGSLHQQGP